MTSHWQPYREPVRATLLRTGTIALVIGIALSRGAWARWPVATLLALWPALGGHFVELWFLNWLRPRISASRGVQVGARLLTWFIGGALLAVAMKLSARALSFGPPRAAEWAYLCAIGGIAFIGIELVVHLVLRLRRRGSFYDGRG